jgi:hypothetical protein
MLTTPEAGQGKDSRCSRAAVEDVGDVSHPVGVKDGLPGVSEHAHAGHHSACRLWLEREFSTDQQASLHDTLERVSEHW